MLALPSPWKRVSMCVCVFRQIVKRESACSVCSLYSEGTVGVGTQNRWVETKFIWCSRWTRADTMKEKRKKRVDTQETDRIHWDKIEFCKAKTWIQKGGHEKLQEAWIKWLSDIETYLPASCYQCTATKRQLASNCMTLRESPSSEPDHSCRQTSLTKTEPWHWVIQTLDFIGTILNTAEHLQ